MRPSSVVSLLLALATAACVRYRAQPVDPATFPAAYRQRRLDDSALVAYVRRWAEPPARARWTDRQLALAALLLRPELARARAQWRAAQVGERSAGARPAPGVEADIERAVSGSGAHSPWVVSLAGLLTVELGGKRGARVQQARARTARAESDLHLTFWRVVQDARAAALSVALAAAELDEAHRELSAVARILGFERERFAEAALTSSELARTGGELQEARAAVGSAERTMLEARARLAGVVGLPARALDSVAVVVSPTAGCQASDSLDSDSLASLALSRRAEVGQALADYAAAEAALYLQVARQYPDLGLGPGFIWDQGVHRWAVALAAPGLLAFRNRAPIAEAIAARSAAAAHIAEVQDSVLVEIGVAVAGCRGGRLEQVGADSQAVVAGRALALAEAAYQRGETTRLDPALAQLGVARAERASRAVERTVRSAALALDAALAMWQGAPGERWPDPREEIAMPGVSH
ncbi:MAG TPA: TolC family protein [Gemmatimonadales bacterium]|nr:TolC family protein [Gemmatimonadales bacterium]